MLPASMARLSSSARSIALDPGHGKIIEEVLEEDLQPGDLLLFPMDRSNSGIAQALFKHAAVYCGDGEVIHFQGTGSQRSPGVITKENLAKIKSEKGQYQVYRKKGGVVPDDFHHRVKDAMNSEAEYDAYTNNCIRFALYLLGLEKFFSQLVKIQDEGDSRHSEAVLGNISSVKWKKVLGSSVMTFASSASLGHRETVPLKFLFCESIPGHGEIFKEVLGGDLQPGDILLFPLDRSNPIVSRILFSHAAVYCGDGEVIHFQGTSYRSPGVTIKEGLEKMKKERGNFEVRRKNGGVVLGDFRRRVRKAMNSEAEYDVYTNNCIHFALSLLGLEEFYSQLVEIEDEGDNSGSSGAAIQSPPSPAEQGSSHTA